MPKLVWYNGEVTELEKAAIPAGDHAHLYGDGLFEGIRFYSKKVYRLPGEAIRAKLYPLLSIPRLRLPHRKSLLRALDLYARSSLDFEDTLTVAHMERGKLTELYSYDREFDHITGLERLEP